jgi:U-box domain
MQDVMRDPVVAEDGHSYERGAIAQWFTEHDTSPLTGTTMGNTRVQLSNRGLRAVAALYHQCMAVALQAEATT